MPSSRRTLAGLSSTTRILAFRMSAERSTDFRPRSFALTGRLSREFQRHVQRGHELVDVDRLGEIPEEPGLQAPLDIKWHRIGTEGNDGNVRRCRVFTQDFQGVEAVDAGQV